MSKLGLMVTSRLKVEHVFFVLINKVIILRFLTICISLNYYSALFHIILTQICCQCLKVRLRRW